MKICKSMLCNNPAVTARRYCLECSQSMKKRGKHTDRGWPHYVFSREQCDPRMPRMIPTSLEGADYGVFTRNGKVPKTLHD